MARSHSQSTPPSSQPKQRKSRAEQAAHRQPAAGISNRPSAEEDRQQDKLPPPGKAKKRT